MQFNSYIWKLYKNSPEGKLAIPTYSSLFNRITNGTFELTLANLPFKVADYTWEIANIIMNGSSGADVKDIFEAENLFSEIAGGFPVTFCDKEKGIEEEVVLSHTNLLYYLTELSVGLYNNFPEYFFPYFFRMQFYLLEQIFDTFGIPLPELPKKNHFDKRLAYYFELCRVLYEFRKNHNLSPEELCAFLYSFAPNFISLESDNILPKPMKVWIVGGGINNNGDPEFLDNADESTISIWQGHVDTRKGDIVLVYCLAPRSSIHSVWRAKTDGYIDPFFHFYNQIWVCSPIKTTPVTYQDLLTDPILSQNGLVKSSMQGLNGRQFTFREYEAILKIMERKGQDISALPRIDIILDPGGNELLKDEREVEINLVEPMLRKFGYENDDWTRQMAVRMGSGEKIYPDYAFFAKQNKGEEQAIMILETKYRIKTQYELYKAYWQAKSYALRLQSKVFIIAAVEGIWVFVLEKTGFTFDKFVHKTWKEIYHPDTFPTIIDLVSKQSLKRIKNSGI
jgi:hypothetical protein